MGECRFVSGDWMMIYPSNKRIPQPQLQEIYWYPPPYQGAAESVCTITHADNGRLNYGKDMTLLIPDRAKPNQEDFIWALPIERVKWNKWYELAKKLRTTCQGVRYLKRMENDKVETLLVMPNEKQSDDDAVTACAYLRMVDKHTCRIYILRCNDDATLNGAGLINAVMGIDPDTLHDVDEDSINKEIEAHESRKP